MQWILFTQTLICNDKINDGAYYATELKLTPGHVGRPRRRAVLVLVPVDADVLAPRSGYLRAVSRALQSRGYIEEIVGTYTVPGNVAQGGGIDQYGQISGFMNFEIGAQGQGGKYVLDGLDYGAAVFNPEGDMGDIEMWELVEADDLPRPPDQAVHGRAWGATAAARRSSRCCSSTARRTSRSRTSAPAGCSRRRGCSAATRAPSAYVHNVYGSDIYEQAARGEAYPVADVLRRGARAERLRRRARRAGTTRTR